jgi:D-glycero-D-manno-heptose 1,7-bisphosphate phosphatase
VVKSRAERRAVFLDRDGVINRPIVREGLPYPPRTLEQFEILPGVPEACQRLREAGFLVIIATNQPDVGRGTLGRSKVEEIHAAMLARVPIDHVFVCYHAGEAFGESCDCRKPKPGMLLTAAGDFGIDLAQSFMIGDRWRDMECGRRAGCQTIFVEGDYKEACRREPTYRVSNLEEAAMIVVSKLPKSENV